MNRKHSAPERAAILRQHLVDKVPISNLCDQHHISPTLFYHWQKELFENAELAFAKPDRRARQAEQAKDDRIAALEAKLRKKDEVLAELMEEHVALKKTLGAP
jgi:transposase